MKRGREGVSMKMKIKKEEFARTNFNKKKNQPVGTVCLGNILRSACM